MKTYLGNGGIAPHILNLVWLQDPSGYIGTLMSLYSVFVNIRKWCTLQYVNFVPCCCNFTSSCRVRKAINGDVRG